MDGVGGRAIPIITIIAIIIAVIAIEAVIAVIAIEAIIAIVAIVAVIAIVALQSYHVALVRPPREAAGERRGPGEPASPCAPRSGVWCSGV